MGKSFKISIKMEIRLKDSSDDEIP